MTPTSLLPATPATPATPGGAGARATAATPATPATPARGKHASAHDGQDGQTGPDDFGSALAMMLAGHLPGTAQAHPPTAEEQGTAPSAGTTETQATASLSAVGSGSLAAALAGERDVSVAVTGAAAAPTPMGAAAVAGSAGSTGSVGTASAGATSPPTLAPPGEPVAAGLRGLTPASQRAGDAADRRHVPSISQLPSTARPARASEAGSSTGDDSSVAASLPSASASASTTSDLAAIAPQVSATTTAVADDPGSTTTTVLRQVFPEIAQVATTPGTHRISITLHPESLGEVKVTVIVRPGGVYVRLAADATAVDGAQARQALLQGAPELHRLLEGTGGDVKVVVQGSQAGQAGTDSHGQSSAQQSPSQNQSQQQAQNQAQTQAQGGEGQHRPSYSPGNAQNLPQAADQPIGAITTTTAGPLGQSRRVDEHAGRLDRLM